MSTIDASTINERNNIEYDEEEVEVEVTDDEAGEEPVEDDNSIEDVKKPKDDKTDKKEKQPNAPIGKVTPSESVKSMEMRSPTSPPPKKGPSFNPDKNPFPTFGAWNEESLSEIQIQFPTLTASNESTNELTRESRPEARYWKGQIAFKYSNFVSKEIRIENVQIPYSDSKNYGTGFVYLALPPAMATAFASAGREKRPTIVQENSLVPVTNRWWKIANTIEDRFGIINGKKFHPRSLDTIFSTTKSGITATLVLNFLFKASTEGREALKPTTPGRVVVEVVRGYIIDVGVAVDPPAKISRKKTVTQPSATQADIATDELMSKLSALGI